MPRATFTPENKATSAFDYPKLFLDKGERARIVIIEPEPLFEFVHTLRKPQVVDGVVVTKPVTRRGETKDEVQYDFVGRHICIGDNTIIEKKGLDSDNCPVCKASAQSDAVQAPQRRFATHIIRYATQPGSFQVQEPYQVSVLAWSFADSRFNELVDLAQEWGDLRQLDLAVGPCEVKQYQKFDLKPLPKAEWLATDERRKVTAQVYQENQSKDLASLIGRRLTREMIEEDLAKVMSAYREAFGRKEAVQDTPTETAAAVDVASLLDPSAAPQPTAETPEAKPPGGEGPPDLSSLLGSDTPAPETDEAPAETPEEEAKPKADGPVLDFNALLNS